MASFASGLKASGWLYKNVGWIHLGSINSEINLSKILDSFNGPDSLIPCFLQREVNWSNAPKEFVCYLSKDGLVKIEVWKIDYLHHPKTSRGLPNQQLIDQSH